MHCDVINDHCTYESSQRGSGAVALLVIAVGYCTTARWNYAAEFDEPEAALDHRFRPKRHSRSVTATVHGRHREAANQAGLVCQAATPLHLQVAARRWPIGAGPGRRPSDSRLRPVPGSCASWRRAASGCGSAWRQGGHGTTLGLGGKRPAATRRRRPGRPGGLSPVRGSDSSEAGAEGARPAPARVSGRGSA